MLCAWVVLILLGGGDLALGAARTASVSGNWSNPATWGGAAVPTATDDITIAAGITVTMDIAGSCRTITNMLGNSSISAGGGTLTIVGNGGLAIANISGTATISCQVVMPATASVTIAGSLTISGVVSGAGTSLTIIGSSGSLLRLSGANIYTGNTILQGNASVYISNPQGLGSNTNPSTIDIPLFCGVYLETNNFTVSNKNIINFAGQLQNNSGAQNWSGSITTPTIYATPTIFANTTFTISGQLTLQGTSMPTIQGPGACIISGLVTGNGSIHKAGGGSLTLSHANDFSGGIVFNLGQLNINNSAALGTGPLNIFSNGPQTIDNTSGSDITTSTYNNAIGLSVDINFIGSNSLNLGTGAVTLNTTPTITVSNNTLTIGGVLSGGYGITKAGAGTLLLSGASTYTGLTTINAGTIKLGATGNATNSPLGTVAAGTSVSSGATLDLNGFTLGTSEPLTLNGTGVSNSGALLNSSGTAVNYNAAITLGSASSIGTNGNITLGGGIIGGQDLTKIGGATLNLGGSTATLGGLTISAGTLISTSVTMNLTGSFVNNSIFTHNNGTVNLNGSTSQTIGGTSTSTFYNLTLNNTAGAILGNGETVYNTLTLTTGNLNIGINIFSFGNAANAVAGGAFSATKMIIASSGGEVRKYGTTASQASFLFPIGDNTGTAEYSPITLNFSGGTYAGYSSVKVVNTKHPNNASSTNYLRRYWTVSQSGYNGYSASISANYVAADIAGSESLQKTGKYVGSLPWVKYSTLGSNTLTATGVTVLGDFTGISNADPTVTISANPSLAVCQNASLTLTANPVGDPTFTYLWSPGGETTQSINPSTVSAGSTVYSVTVTDGNGITATNTATVTVNALPVIMTQPTDELDCEGHIVSFNVVATGSGLTYSWQRKKPSGSFLDIPVELNVSYPSPGTIRLQNVGNADAPNGTQYRVIITNSDNCSITSNAATLTVNEITGIVPTATSVTICQGDNYSYTVSTSYPSNVVSYQWKKWNNPGQWDAVIDGGPVSGATTNQLVFTGATPTESGRYKVTVVFHSSGADCNVTSDTRNRELIVNPLSEITPGGPDFICQSSAPSPMALTGAAIGGGATTAAWSITNLTPANGGVNGTLSSSAQTSSPETVTYTPPANYSGTVTLTLTTNDPAGPCGGTSATRTITISQLPTTSPIYHR